MCTLYSMTKSQEAIRSLAKVLRDKTGNLPSLPGIFPDYPAPIVCNSPEARELVMARWGMHPRHSRSRERMPTSVLPTPEREVAPLAALAWHRQPLPCSLQQLFGKRASARRH